MPIIRIQNCFDSHLHWLETGASASRLVLSGLKKPEDVKHLEVKKENFLEHWLLGFSWDEHQWPNQAPPHRKILDEVFDFPVCFYRADFHAMWLNTLALKEVGLFEKHISKKFDFQKGKILEDEEGWPTGVLVESAFNYVDERMPQPSSEKVRRDLLKGMEIFNQAGFTHIRSFTRNPDQWKETVKLSEEGCLTLASETFFVGQEDFAKAVSQCKEARKELNEKSLSQLRAPGVKIFLDGALGSEGAYLSHDYSSKSGRGFLLFSPSEILEKLEWAWNENLEVAVHCIGDEAAHQLALAVDKLCEKGLKGQVHIEHAEILRPETIEIIKKRKMSCHIQPCHWLTDRNWLKEKLGSLKNVFSWRALEEAGVEFYFGSDSPIEPPCLFDTETAVSDTETQGVPPLKNDWWKYHQHKDNLWVPDSYTEIDQGKVKKVVYEGKTIFTA